MPESVSAAPRWAGSRAVAAVTLLAVAAVLFALGMPRAGAEGPTQPCATDPTTSPSSSPSASPTASTDPEDSPARADADPESDCEPSTPTATQTVTVTATPTPTATPTEGPTPGPVKKTPVNGATLYWAMNHEATNKAFAADTYNFFSAGTLSKVRRFDNTIRPQDWNASAGNVTIQKFLNGKWRTATWQDTSTDTKGAKVTSPTSGAYTGLQMAFGKGSGTMDEAAGSADIQWRGKATVVSYSGFTAFRIEDPRLVVVGGAGQLTARVIGYGTDRDQGENWVESKPRQVTLATLDKVQLSAKRFTVTPTYAGVRIPAGLSAKQVTDTPGWGAFPASFVSFAEELGTAPFWYTSGGVADPAKVALPLTVSFAGAPAVAPSQAPNEKENPVVSPPVAPTPPPAPAVPQPVADNPVAVPSAVPEPVTVQAAPPALPAAVAVTSNDVAPVSAQVGPAGVSTTWWWSGSGLLLLAAVLLTIPLPRASARP